MNQDSLPASPISPLASLTPLASPRLSDFPASPRLVAYAGFWIRVLARFIDSFILTLLSLPIIFAIIASANSVASSSTYSSSHATLSPFLILVILVYSLFAIFVYDIYLIGRGGTPGMRALGLRVVDANDPAQTIGFWRAGLRYLGYVLAGIPFDLGVLWIAFDDQKRGWHDMIASSHVIYA